MKFKTSQLSKENVSSSIVIRGIEQPALNSAAWKSDKKSHVLKLKSLSGVKVSYQLSALKRS
jgi:hypothetical protein